MPGPGVWDLNGIVGPFASLAEANAWAASNSGALYNGLLATVNGSQVVWRGASVGWAPVLNYAITAKANSFASDGISLIGDSTGNELTEWFGLLAGMAAESMPDRTVEFRTWDNVNEVMLPPIVISQVGGVRRVVQTLTGAAGRTLATKNLRTDDNSDLDIRIKCEFPVSYSDRFLVCCYNVSGNNRGFLFETLADGKLRIRWSSDGISINRTMMSSADAAIPANTPIWLRCTVDIDNGSGGSTVSFYKSTNDGSTWTKIGSDIVTAGVVGINRTAAHLEVFGYNGAGTSSSCAGTVYRLFLSEGINGASIVPELPEHWGILSSSLETIYGETSGIYVDGSPLFSLVSGSHPGADIEFLTATDSRFGKLTPNLGCRTVIVSSNHNEGTKIDASMVTTLNTLKTKIEQRNLYSTVFLLTQNPKTGGLPKYNLSQNLRRETYRQYCAKTPGWTLIDTYLAFLQYSPSEYLLPDNIHPNAFGSRIWAYSVGGVLGI